MENGPTFFVSVLGIRDVHWVGHGFENVGVEFLDSVVDYIIVALIEQHYLIAYWGLGLYLGLKLLGLFRLSHSEVVALGSMRLIPQFEATERREASLI